MRVRRIFICLFVVLMMFLSACKSNDADIPGYFIDSHVATGGKRADNANLSEINVTATEDGGEIITFTFVSGSVLAGDSEIPMEYTPPYSVSMMTSPARVFVTLQNILYWDFVPYSNPDGSMVSGIFRNSPSGSNEANIYIQLNQDAVFKTEEKDNQLLITVLPKKQTVSGNAQEIGYYVVLDAFEEYLGDKIPKEFALHPTLTNDYFSPVLISPPFALDKEAQQQAMKINDHLGGIMPGKEAVVEEIRKNEVLKSVNSVDLQEAEKLIAAIPVDDSFDISILAADARFIAYLPGGNVLLAKPNQSIYDDIESETLWLLENSKLKPVSDAHFAAISQAKLSQNGAYLAFKEEAESSNPLYLLEVESGTLSFLGEELGTHTLDFAWGNDGLLYAVAGNDDDTSLKVYDPSKMMRDELLTLLIGDKIKTEGNIRPIGSYIYYSDATGVIYQFDTDNENTVKISEGTRFTTSPDDRILAVAGYEESVDEDTYSLLKTVTLSNGQEQIISKGRFIADFTWSSDSQRLYYLLYIDIPEDYDGSGEDLESEMLCELYVYDLATTENKYLGQLNTASIYSGTTQNELIFSSGFQQDWRYVWVTYGLDIK